MHRHRHIHIHIHIHIHARTHTHIHTHTHTHTYTHTHTQASPPDVDNVLIPLAVLLTGFYLSGSPEYAFLFQTNG